MSGRFILTLGVFLLYYVLATVHLARKAGLPDEYISPSGTIGIIALGGNAVKSPDDVEFLLSSHRIGDRVEVTVLEQGKEIVRDVVLGHYYTTGLILFDLISIMIIFGIGIVVNISSSDRLVGGVFYAATGTLAMALIGTKTIYTLGPAWLGYPLCFLFFLAYSFLPVFFLHFSTIFPRRNYPRVLNTVKFLYGAGAVMAIWQALSYFDAAEAASLEIYLRSVSNAVWMNVFMMGGIAASLIVMVISYRGEGSLGDRRKLAWILYGLVAGTAPFVFLWALPQTLGLAPLIPEFIFKICLLFIPACFSIAILKYRLLDITIIINRSVFHGIVIGVLLVLYTVLIAVTLEFISQWTFGSSVLVSAIAAILVVVAYDPVRKWAQNLVDRSFFRVGYDFRGSLKQLLEELKQSTGVEEMASVLVAGIERLLPAERIGYFVLTRPENRLRLIAHRNFGLLDTHTVRFESEHLMHRLDRPVALDGAVEPTVVHEAPANPEVFRRWGMALALPMKSSTGEILGFLVLGEKKSGLGFSEEDVDLLTVLKDQAARETERLMLQRSLLLEQAEAERLEELNRMKSFFVSSVSHDLKTPLTSIRMFAELLRTEKKLGRTTVEEYLQIIEGESERLARLINNVLDFAKIERGVKEYNFREADLNAVVEKACAIMEYQFRMENATVRPSLSDGTMLIMADSDAVLEALLNLISNGLKYSPGEKTLEIATFREKDLVCVSVKDSGIGIPAEEQANVFRAFYRVKGKAGQSAGGTGLGLAVVKHIMDAHKGRIDLHSEKGKGTRIQLSFTEMTTSTN